MARMIEAEARITAIDATGEVFARIGQKVRGLANTMKYASTGAAQVNSGLNRLGKTMNMLAPMAATSGAFAGLRGVSDLVHATIKATAEGQHETLRALAAGMTSDEVRQELALAAEESEKFKIFTQTQIQHMLRNLRSITGTYKGAVEQIDPMLRLRVIAEAAHPGGGEEVAEDFDQLAKSFEALGVSMDPKRLADYADAMARTILVSGDTLKVGDYRDLVVYGREAALGWSKEFLTTVAPELAQRMSGGTAGRGLEMDMRSIVEGHLGHAAAQGFAQLGLLDLAKVRAAGDITKTGSIKGAPPGAVAGSRLFTSNPYEWVKQYLLPAMQRSWEKAGGHGAIPQDQLIAHIGALFPTRGAAPIEYMALQQAQFDKAIALYKQADPHVAVDSFLNKDVGMAWQGFEQQVGNFLRIAGGPLAEPAARALNALAAGIVALEKATAGHPAVATGGVGAALAGGLWGAYKLGKWGLGAGYRMLTGAGTAAVDDLSGTAAIRAMQMALPGAAEAGPSLLGALGTSAGLLGLGLPLAAGASIWAGGKAQDYFGDKDMSSSVPGVGYVPGMPMPEVKGNADLNVSVQVEPSDSFVARIVSAIRNDINVFSGGGTAGSTGVSMPEATPNP